MRRILTILLVASLFAGCCTNNGGFCRRNNLGTTCVGADGYTLTAVAYGDSKIIVIPISDIVPDTEWRFVLAPFDPPRNYVGVDYKTALVTIKGKRSPEDDWIDVSGTFNGSGRLKSLVECVTPPVRTVGTSYQYEVKVEFVGEIDPRGVIIRR